MHRASGVVIAFLIVAGLATAGCAGNGDGSTTCQDFTAMSSDARGATIAKMLKEHNGLNSSTRDVESRVAATLRSCGSAENSDKTVEAVNF